MLPAYLLSLREGLEAALIIGIVLGAIHKIRRDDLSPAVWFGTGSAIAASLLIAVGLTVFGLSLEGAAEEIFEGLTMLLAAGILTWMIFWMGKQARFLKGELEAGVSKAVASTGNRAVFWLAFVAVVREGIELAIFITAAVFVTESGQANTNLLPTLAGTLLGLGTAALLGWMLLSTTTRLDLRRFFLFTGILLLLFAAGLVAHGVHEFNEAGLIPTVVDHIWDLNGIFDENSFAGLILKTLFGYNANPSLTEMLAYFVYLIGVSVFWRRDQAAPVKSPAPSQA